MNKLTIYVSTQNDLLVAKNPDTLFPEIDHKTKLPLHPIKICDKVLNQLSYITCGDSNRSLATHSEDFISKIGDYIAVHDKEIRHHVEVVILYIGGSTQVATFDEDGCLVNWSTGFFCGG